ncbi:MAG: hypothetical protein WBO95_19335 [Candidatus Dechloromonas phosphoritropha]|jgi:hypothetical protein
MADTKTIGKAATEAPLPVPAVAHPSPGEAGPGSASPAPAVDWPSKEAQVLLQAAKNAPAELANLPHTVAETLPRKLAPMEAYLNAELPVLEALPLQDLIFGGSVLVAVVIVQAIGIRLLTARFEKRALDIEKGPAWWSVDLLLGFTVFRMLGLHLASIVLWSAALFYGGIIPEWGPAARFVALSYTTLGSDRVLSAEWHMLSPIIAISGMFTFAWTASVLVNIIGRCDELRGVRQNTRQARRTKKSGGKPDGSSGAVTADGQRTQEGA